MWRCIPLPSTDEFKPEVRAFIFLPAGGAVDMSMCSTQAGRRRKEREITTEILRQRVRLLEGGREEE